MTSTHMERDGQITSTSSKKTPPHEHCTGFAEVMDSTPVQACLFLVGFFHYCLISVHNVTAAIIYIFKSNLY